jgi:hypothetical protein
MVRISRSISLAVFALLLGLCSTMRAGTYYVDSAHGSDFNPGTAESAPWKTLGQVNRTDFGPGDHILLDSDSVWHEQLAPKSSGGNGHPIVLDRYGSGAIPRIAGDGTHQDTILLRNVQNIELHHLEITNHGNTDSPRRGLYIFLDNYGTARNIVIADLYIHDVNGTNREKDNGGIIFRTNGDRKPSRFDGLTIERNIVWKADRSGIVADSYHASRTHWFPSLHVVIRDNYVEDIGGDGIVPWATDGALVEGNIVRRCNQRSTDYNAGIWQWSTDNTVLRLNEVSETGGTHDGEGFDSDYNSRNTRFEYNYGHDNGGGFMLICTPVKRDQRSNLGNTGTVVRYNISRNDHTRLINLSGADDVTVENNAFYVGPGRDVQMLVSGWLGWSRNAIFRDNSFYVKGGILRFGHAASRNEDGTYEIAPGWGPAENIVFTGNRYFGKVVNPPSDYQSANGAIRHFSAAQPDWNEPSFDPSHPQEYRAFIAPHRAWMIRLFQQQFGHAPQQTQLRVHQ